MISFGRLLKLVMFLQIQSFVIQSKCLGFLWTEIKKKKEKKNQFRSTLGGRTILPIHLHLGCTWASLVWLLLLRSGSWDSSAAVEAAFSAAMRICEQQHRKRDTNSFSKQIHNPGIICTITRSIYTTSTFLEALPFWYVESSLAAFTVSSVKEDLEKCMRNIKAGNTTNI